MWDLKKENLNIKKHKVSFTEAASVFTDEKAVALYDHDHSEGEDRLILVGYSNKARLLFVVYVERLETTYRIISARKAKKIERNLYEEKY